MIKVEGLEITVSRGDTGTLEINFDSCGDPLINTTALISIQKVKGEPNRIWEKRVEIDDNHCVLDLAHEDTNLPCGDYWWDIRLLSNGGSDIMTPFEPQKFKIVEVVGNV